MLHISTNNTPHYQVFSISLWHIHGARWWEIPWGNKIPCWCTMVGIDCLCSQHTWRNEAFNLKPIMVTIPHSNHHKSSTRFTPFGKSIDSRDKGRHLWWQSPFLRGWRVNNREERPDPKRQYIVSSHVLCAIVAPWAAATAIESAICLLPQCTALCPVHLAA